MICDKHREQRALYFPLLHCSTFSQHSDFIHFTPMTELRSSYEKKYLTEDKISAELVAYTLFHFPDNDDSDSESDSDPSVVENRQNKCFVPLRKGDCFQRYHTLKHC
jgi:hypothetical protein